METSLILRIRFPLYFFLPFLLAATWIHHAKLDAPFYVEISFWLISFLWEAWVLTRYQDFLSNQIRTEERRNILTYAGSVMFLTILCVEDPARWKLLGLFLFAICLTKLTKKFARSDH